jgi:hypothetical protein
MPIMTYTMEGWPKYLSERSAATLHSVSLTVCDLMCYHQPDEYYILDKASTKPLITPRLLVELQPEVCVVTMGMRCSRKVAVTPEASKSKEGYFVEFAHMHEAHIWGW